MSELWAGDRARSAGRGLNPDTCSRPGVVADVDPRKSGTGKSQRCDEPVRRRVVEAQLVRPKTHTGIIGMARRRCGRRLTVRGDDRVLDWTIGVQSDHLLSPRGCHPDLHNGGVAVAAGLREIDPGWTDRQRLSMT